MKSLLANALVIALLPMHATYDKTGKTGPMGENRWMAKYKLHMLCFLQAGGASRTILFSGSTSIVMGKGVGETEGSEKYSTTSSAGVTGSKKPRLWIPPLQPELPVIIVELFSSTFGNS